MALTKSEIDEVKRVARAEARRVIRSLVEDAGQPADAIGFQYVPVPQEEDVDEFFGPLEDDKTRSSSTSRLPPTVRRTPKVRQRTDGQRER